MRDEWKCDQCNKENQGYSHLAVQEKEVIPAEHGGEFVRKAWSFCSYKCLYDWALGRGEKDGNETV